MLLNILLYFLLPSFFKFIQFSMADIKNLPILTENCKESGRRIYYRTEGSEGELDNRQILSTLNGISLQECAKNCTEMDKCHSFQFRSDDQLECILLANDLPQSSSRKVRQPLLSNSIAHFQGICISNEIHLNCPSAYAFERFPGHVLFGHAHQSFLVANLAECLSACLNAKRQFRMECLSAMYFYVSGLCILNREHRKSVQPADGIFRMGNELVDYFDNICTNVVCDESAELHWLQTEHFKIDPSREVILLGKTLEECKQICIENRIHGMEFPCKAFVYSNNKKQCQLSAESGILRPKFGRGKIRMEETIYANRRHKRHIMKPDFRQIDFEGSNEQFQLDWELAAFSAGQYYEKMCIEPIEEMKGELSKIGENINLNGGEKECNSRENVGSFEFYPGKMLSGLKEMQIIRYKILGECLWACANAGANCRSVQIAKKTDECILSSASQLSNPVEQFQQSSEMDYYENLLICPSILTSTNLTNLFDENLGKRAIRERKQRPIMVEVVREKSKLDENEFKNEIESGTKNAIIETDCRMSGIEVKAKFIRPSTGILFVRVHSQNCSAKFNETMMATLSLSIPSHLNSSNECPPMELGPMHWSYIIVLQENEQKNGKELGMNILMGNERIFNVTCDFSNTTKTLENQTMPFALDEANLTANNSNEPPKLEKMDGNDQPISLQMSLLRDGQPVNAVSLGEELELRWNFVKELENNSMPKYGMFIDSCIAERIDGELPNPEPLTLIIDGCPEPRVHAAHLIGPLVKRTEDGAIETRLRVFRFDGSRRVRIRCAVDVCVRECAPANCSTAEENLRKKRGIEGGEEIGLTTLGELAELVQKYDQLRRNEEGDDGWSKEEEKHNKNENNGRMSTRNGGGNGLVQKSTTISGSYTINDDENEDEREEQQWKRPPKTQIILTGNGIKKQNQQLQRPINLVELLKRKEDDEAKGISMEIPIAFLGGKKENNNANAESNGEELRKRACQEFPTSILDSPMSSTFCINRPFAIIVIIFIVILATIQIFQFIRLFRHQFPFAHRKNSAIFEEEINLPDPPIPTIHQDPLLSRNSRECEMNGFGDGNLTFRHLDSCLQEEGNQFTRNSGIFVGEEQNRRQSILSVDSPFIIRPIPHPRQTVFPPTTKNVSTKFEHHNTISF